MTATTDKPATGDAVRIVLAGRISASTAAPIWRAAIQTLTGSPDRHVVVDALRIEYVDDVGLALLFDLMRRERPPIARTAARA